MNCPIEISKPKNWQRSGNVGDRFNATNHYVWLRFAFFGFIVFNGLAFSLKLDIVGVTGSIPVPPTIHFRFALVISDNEFKIEVVDSGKATIFPRYCQPVFAAHEL